MRENLELQERLVAAEQAKVDLEDRLTATRSEVLCCAVLLLLTRVLDIKGSVLHCTVNLHSMWMQSSVH